MLPLSVFPSVFQFFERFPALIADVRSRSFVGSHVAFVMALAYEFLAALAAAELEPALVRGHVRAQRPFRLERLGTVVAAYLGRSARTFTRLLRSPRFVKQ